MKLHLPEMYPVNMGDVCGFYCGTLLIRAYITAPVNHFPKFYVYKMSVMERFMMIDRRHGSSPKADRSSSIHTHSLHILLPLLQGQSLTGMVNTNQNISHVMYL